ncbi:glycoside hydrolase family 28 protein [Segatella copri]|uniref:glycoside hydrolase family 28 protein n=1 Tax=Segatella copri TaxID=165179 RepID=UPI001F35AA1B|nr:glycosyl hydrolase family 28 protein [Segatella copri]
MKKSIIKTVVLAALMALPMFTKAQTFAGITAEQIAQNTPEGWTAVSLPQLPTITSANTFNIKDYGASTTAEDNTKAIQKALDAVPSSGGMVVIPAGTWMFGSTDQMTSKTEVLSIKSKTVLHLCAGATLKLVEYGKAPNNKTVFIGCKNKNQSDIVIEGEGETSIIDGQGTRWWKARDNKETFNPGAMIRFEKGSRFLIRNLKVQNSPGVNITLSNSNGANNGTVHDVTIYNPSSETKTEQPSHNTDGISIWGHHMNIYNCNISTGDDNVVCDDNAQYIHVWNCDFGTGHGASIGSFTKNIKHVWFDNITMNGTTAGIRMKTGINSNGTLRGGGEEDWKFTNFTMTNVKNPFSIDCFYDKNYNSDPAVDKANARTLDSTTPTYNGILLQNVKTTDVCDGNAIFLIGRPESHIKNVTLDNVQISAKKGIDIRFVDNLVFKNNSKITCQSGKLWIRQYDSTVDDQCDATGAGTNPNPTPNPGETTEVSYILDASTSTSSSTDPSPWTFNNGCSIESSKGYATAKNNTIKYSKGVQFTINLPENITITSATFAGYTNEDNKTCYLGELNGTTFASDKYVFPSRLTQTDTSTKFDITLDTPATGVLTFTPQNAQAAWVITLKGVKVTSSGINNVVLTAKVNNNNIYDLSGRMVKLNAKAEDLQGLKKGIYIYNNKKYVAK